MSNLGSLLAGHTVESVEYRELNPPRSELILHFHGDYTLRIQGDFITQYSEPPPWIHIHPAPSLHRKLREGRRLETSTPPPPPEEPGVEALPPTPEFQPLDLDSEIPF